MTQLLLLGLLSGQRVAELRVLTGPRDAHTVNQLHKVRVHLLAQRLSIGPPPGCRVTVAMVTLRGGGVDQELGGGDETGDEDVTKLGE